MKKNVLLIPCGIFTLLVSLIFPADFIAQTNKATYINGKIVSSRKPVNISLLEHRVFELINQKRTENGLGLLIWNEQVAAVARLHSGNMALNDFFSHSGLDGKEVDSRADSLGLRKWRMIGENIAYNRGYDDPVEHAIEGWMQSAGHRKNILRNNWKETGIGISVSTDGKYYLTQVFLQRK